MVSVRRLAGTLVPLLCSVSSLARGIGTNGFTVVEPGKRGALQDLVTWDSKSLFVRGERIMFYSGEFHPFRLPVPGLWLDVMQKIKALGYTGVSFYVDWALLEGRRGHFTAEGVFDFKPFFDAASEAGLYLLARPGPYINGETAGGGFPGWLQNVRDILRTNETGYLEATETYVAGIGRLIADAQITHGGPVIALQPENEYTNGASWVRWPDVQYMQKVNQLYRDAGIVVPFINNEAYPVGLMLPGQPGGPDIYGHDCYPIGWACDKPDVWNKDWLPSYFRDKHNEQSPSTPFALMEYQGGALDHWGGWGLDACATLTGPEFERVAYKNAFSFGTTIFNIYMTYGGTNWGNLGQPDSYTSYDYGAPIKEDRTIFREKYAEAKLLAQFIAATPAYLEATAGKLTTTKYTNTTDLAVTPLNGNKTNIYVIRHNDYTSTDATPYTFTVPTSAGDLTIPQLGGTLVLNGRDSKVVVTDYDVGGHNLLYSSADVFTQGASGERRVLLLYGNAGEMHELAFPSALGKPTVEGDASTVTVGTKGSAVVVQWKVTEKRKVLHYGSNLDVYLLWRNDAFNYWVLQLEAPAPVGNYTAQGKETVIASGPYLLRTASKAGTALYLTGDLNVTTTLEIVAGPAGSNTVYFNGEKVPGVTSAHGRLSATLAYKPPKADIPDLATLDWRYVDSLPEVRDGYDDSAWVECNKTTTVNPRDDQGNVYVLKTPTSLIAGDYGFHTSSFIYRGHFTANGNESSFSLWTQSGNGYGHSAWLDGAYLGSHSSRWNWRNQTFALPAGLLARGGEHVLTVVVDHTGDEPNWTPGLDLMKTPRGILSFGLEGHPQADVRWRMTGNLGGNWAYRDAARGPLNEGALWAERQGYHLPAPPRSGWARVSPIGEGLKEPGVGFFSALVELDLPVGYDVPLSLVFSDTGSADFRVQIYVNGYQFGRYINNVGPQTVFPVPQGILNYRGTNHLALTLWAQQEGGARIGGLALVATAKLQSGMRDPGLSPVPAWSLREGAY